MRLFNTQLVARVMAKGMPEGEPIEAKSVSKGVRTAQKAVESRNFEIRKNVLKYDDVMNKQRTVIYAERQAVLKGADIHEDILKFIDDTVLSYIKGANNGSDKPADWDWDGLFKAISSVYPIAVEQEAAKDAVDKLKGDKAVEALKELIVSDARTSTPISKTSSAAKACASSSAAWCSPCSTASGVNTSTRWTTSRTASACAVWASATRWSNTSVKATRCTTP